MKVLIVSKTHMADAACVGALGSNGQSYRLLDKEGKNQPLNTDFEIRQVWEIGFIKRHQITAPHNEDVLVYSKKLIRSLKSNQTMLDVIRRLNVTIWEGSPDNLFDGSLSWTQSGCGYISIDGKIPDRSTGFWLPDKNLTKRIFYEKERYYYPNKTGWRSFPYVGFEDSIDTIPVGTLVRVSLARWWDRNKETERRCALQLSGWYELVLTNNQNT